MELKVIHRARSLAAFCFLASVSALAAGCSGSMQGGGIGGANGGAVSALEGRYVDSNGIVSTFHNGIFESRSGDTSEKLSEGNYVASAGNMVTLEVRSLVRGTVSHVNCSIAGDKLYCTTETNAKFILTRG